ncbi:MAG: Maf family protein [Lachnospiraceae bacterium]
MRFILASGSPRRRELLTQVGIIFEVITSSVDEVVTVNNPDQVVESLSKQKAEDVFHRIKDVHEDMVVIGADTVVASEGKILGKPKNEMDAYNMIEGIAGKTHSVFTGVTLCMMQNGKERTITFSAETKVMVDVMTPENIRDYIATGESLDKAGAYGIQGRFAAYVTGIEGDYNNVVGLPVGRLCKVLRQEGIL